MRPLFLKLPLPNLSLSTLLRLSESRRDGIISSPLSESYADELYHRKDSHVTLADLNASTSKDLIFGSQDACLRSYLDRIDFQNQAHSGFAPFRAGAGEFWGLVDYKLADGTAVFRIYPLYSLMQARVTPFALEPVWNDVNAVWNFQSWDGAARQICAILGGGEWKIPRAGDIEHRLDSQGVILTDRTTATKYRLLVDNGVLDMEAA